MKFVPIFLIAFLSFFLSLFFLQSPTLAIILICFISFCALFWFFPKVSLFFFFLFLIFQGVIAYLTKAGIIYNFDELGVLCMAVLLILRKLITKQPFYISNIDIPLVFLISIGLISSIVFKIVPFSIALGGLLLFLKGFIIFYIFMSVEIDVTDIKRFSSLLYIIGIFTLIYGVLGLIWPGFFLAKIGVSFSGRFGIPALQSFLGHPGGFSAFMGILFCFSFAGALIKNKLRYYILPSLFFLGIIFSLRRTTLTGVFLIVLFVILSKSIQKIIGLRFSFKTIFVILTVFIVFLGLGVILYKDLSTYYVAQESPRSELLKTGLKISADYFPLGAGFGTYSGGINQKFYSPLFYKYQLNNIWGLSESQPSFINDTFWPHVLAETGVFGFICYVLIIWIFFSICFKSMKYFKDNEKVGFAVVSIFLLLISLVESTKATFYEMTLWTFFYFGSIGILQSWIARARNNEDIAS